MFKKKYYNALIIGSNFGYNSHFKALKKINIFNIDISSPNIKNKNIKDKKIRKFSNYKNALKKNQYHIITFAVPPKIQEKIIKHIINKKISVKYLFFEKLYSSDIKFLNNSFNYFIKKNILINLNFIFPKLTHWKSLSKLLKNEKVKFIKYRWFFKQAFFTNLQKTWKIDHKKGGGLYFYYLIHLIYNLITLFKKIKIINLTKTSNNKHKLVDYLSVRLLCGNKIPCEIDISNNSNNNIHQLKIETEKNMIELISKSKNWTNKFMIKKNMKNKFKFNNKQSNERYMLTFRNIKDLLNYKSTSEKKYIRNLSRIIASHKITKKISMKNE